VRYEVSPEAAQYASVPDLSSTVKSNSPFERCVRPNPIDRNQIWLWAVALFLLILRGILRLAIRTDSRRSQLARLGLVQQFIIRLPSSEYLKRGTAVIEAAAVGGVNKGNGPAGPTLLSWDQCIDPHWRSFGMVSLWPARALTLRQAPGCPKLAIRIHSSRAQPLILTGLLFRKGLTKAEIIHQLCPKAFFTLPLTGAVPRCQSYCSGIERVRHRLLRLFISISL